MPGRNFSSNTYRYGFNGKENDNEVKSVDGSQQDYGMRIFDPRLGRFLSVDPISYSFPMLTPYQFASNTPIMAIDLDGKEAQMAINGTIVYGSVDLKVINARIIKDDPSVLANNNLIQVNAKMMANGIDQKPYATLDPAPKEEAPLFEYKASIKLGFKGSLKTKVLGFGGEASAGKSQKVFSATLTEEGGTFSTAEKTSISGSLGVGALKVGVSKDVPNGDLKGEFEVGPKTLSCPSDVDDHMLTIFDLGAQAGIGLEVSLKVNQNLALGAIGASGPETPGPLPDLPMIANDATNVDTKVPDEIKKK